MIKRFSITTHTHNAISAPCEENFKWDAALIGENKELDERSKAASAYATNNALRTLVLRFDVNQNQLFINGEASRVTRLHHSLTGVRSLLIEATTLSFPEIVYAIYEASKAKVQKMRLVYVEPQGYRRKIKEGLCDFRNFELSDNRRFQSIPHFQTDLQDIDPGRAVFFVGYEGPRLGQALEQIEVLQSWQKHVVFGIPAFEPGWEIDALANNVQHLTNKDDQVQYVSAASAEAAYLLLSDLRRNDKEGRPILVAPLGTKPHAIGVALFLIEHESMDHAVLLYDHPTPSKERSNEVRRWHFFDVVDTIV
jgi:hypothetical protein